MLDTCATNKTKKLLSKIVNPTRNSLIFYTFHENGYTALDEAERCMVRPSRVHVIPIQRPGENGTLVGIPGLSPPR